MFLTHTFIPFPFLAIPRYRTWQYGLYRVGGGGTKCERYINFDTKIFMVHKSSRVGSPVLDRWFKLSQNLYVFLFNLHRLSDSILNFFTHEESSQLGT